jgi:hypothetical protein
MEHIACVMGPEINTENLVGKNEALEPLERVMHRWESIIKTDIKEVG